ncbi:MAG: response regulator, partial [Chloroflexota bacterium]
MRRKRILIVDDEEPILVVLKKSLEKLDPGYEVDTATDGFAALDKLQTYQYDLVITDFNMASMDGLELMETIHYLQPAARVIMITAYGCDALEAEASRLQVYRYLTKPLEISSFRHVVQEALGDQAISHSGILVLSDDRYEQVNGVIGQLLADVGARCIFLTDAEGRTIARVGNTDKLPVDEMASLLGGSIVTLAEVSRVLDDDEEAVNLAYHEGKHEYLYALNIGLRMLLIMIIDRGPYSCRLGSAWYYAQNAALTLRQILSHAKNINSRPLFDKTISQ